MNTIPISSSTTHRRRSNNRFMEPGTLAQIRNSKITARSHIHRLVSLAQTQNLRSSSSSALQIPVLHDRDQIPQFIGKICASGPLCLRRKKLAAAKSVYIPNIDPNPNPSPVLDSVSADSLLSVLSNDVLVAH